MHLFASESLQFENEINAQINSFNCLELNIPTEEYKEQAEVLYQQKT